MIRYLTHDNIDKKRWDECIDDSANHLIYGYSWYLDMVCENWDALVTDDYSAVFPLPYKKKFGVQYIYPPIFTQQLGMFYKKSCRFSIDDFLNNIPSKFRFIEIYLSSANLPKNSEVKSRNNYFIYLGNQYSDIRNNYSTRLKRNLKKAEQFDLTITPHADIIKILDIFRENKGDDLGLYSDSEYKFFRRLFYSLEHKGHARSWGAYNKRNELIGGVIFFFDQKSAILIFSGLNEEGKTSRAMPKLIDHIISQYSGTELYLDFEGSMQEGLAHFYSSFGAELQHYWYYKKNRLPKVFRILFQFYKYLKRRTK